MAARNEAPRLRNAISSLGPDTPHLTRRALPVAQELYEAGNARFGALLLYLRMLYGDDAAPRPLNSELLARASRARDARLVDESLARGATMPMDAAEAAQLRGPPTRAEAATALRDEPIRACAQELAAQDARSGRGQLAPDRRHWSSELEDATLSAAATAQLVTAATGLALLIAEVGAATSSSPASRFARTS